MIYPRKTPPEQITKSGQWIFCSKAAYETAVKLNLMEQEKELVALRATVQSLESDIHDMKMSRRTAFLRCECGRVREKGMLCRGCQRGL